MRNLIKSVLFFSGLYVLIVFFVYILKTKEEFVFDKTSVRIKKDEIAKEKDNSLDVIFLGDSICYSSFSPQIIWDEQGITSYVGASSAQRLCDSYAILKSACETQNPKVVVLETTCLYRSINIEENNDDYVLNVFYRKLPLFEHHSNWKDAADKVINSKMILEKKSIRGFVSRTNVNEYTGGEYMIPSEKRDMFSNIVEKYLNSINQICNDNNIKLLLVSSPSPVNWSWERYNAVYDWAIKNNVTYLDLNSNKDIAIDWKNDTKDGGDHLNLYGATKVSKYLANYLINSYDIEDKRNDSAYADWLAYSNQTDK